MAVLLVVEDDVSVRNVLIRDLYAHGHTVRSVGTALEALRQVSNSPPEVVILDLGLPDLDGREAMSMLRSVSDVPTIVATVRDDEREIVRLLRSGADDYLTKPFSSEQLAARIETVLRRTAAPSPTQLTVGELVIDPDRRSARLAQSELQLSRREFDMLVYLARRPGSVVSRRELLSNVWQQAYGDDQTIDVHLSWLRRKFREVTDQSHYLHTVRGVGVKLEAP